MHGHLNVNLSRCTVTWTSIYHDARSPERQFITMHGHLNVNLSRCTVTWTSIYHDAQSPERQFITMHGHLNVNLSRCTVTRTSRKRTLTAYRLHMNYRFYKIIVPMNLCTKNLERCESVDRIFITGAPAWRWRGEYVTLDKMFYNLLFKEEAVAAPVTVTYSSLSQSSRLTLLTYFFTAWCRVLLEKLTGL